MPLQSRQRCAGCAPEDPPTIVTLQQADVPCAAREAILANSHLTGVNLRPRRYCNSFQTISNHFSRPLMSTWQLSAVLHSTVHHTIWPCTFPTDTPILLLHFPKPIYPTVYINSGR